jgi:soluble lytic murein transglycosylase
MLSAAEALRLAETIHSGVLAPEGPDNSTRIAHLRELLGKRSGKLLRGRVAKKAQAELQTFVRETLDRALRAHGKPKLAARIHRTVLEESRRHGFDPLFLLAVIENESSFDPEAVGTSGEIGLMQILPETGRWIAQKSAIAWKGKRTLRDPVANIQIGAAYLALLRERFDSHSQLYIAAYNMGQGNVSRALERKIRPREYPLRVMERYLRLYSELEESPFN